MSLFTTDWRRVLAIVPDNNSKKRRRQHIFGDNDVSLRVMTGQTELVQAHVRETNTSV